jgi:tetratricopeptide (TPR) repeat protein
MADADSTAAPDPERIPDDAPLDPARATDRRALRMLRCAAACAPAPIPRPLLYAAASDNPGEPLPAAVGAAALARLVGTAWLDEPPGGDVRLLTVPGPPESERVLGEDDPAERVDAALLAELGSAIHRGPAEAIAAYLPHLHHRAARAAARADAEGARFLDTAAGLLHDLGDLAAARPLYEQALAIREAVLGPEHADTAVSLNNLALLLRALGDLDAAGPLYERALAVAAETLGPDHPTTTAIEANLAALQMVLFFRAMGTDLPDLPTQNSE